MVCRRRIRTAGIENYFRRFWTLTTIKFSTTGDSFGSISAAHSNFLGVRLVPFAASQAANLSVPYVETRRSELNDQRPRSALYCRCALKCDRLLTTQLRPSQLPIGQYSFRHIQAYQDSFDRHKLDTPNLIVDPYPVYRLTSNVNADYIEVRDRRPDNYNNGPIISFVSRP